MLFKISLVTDLFQLHKQYPFITDEQIIYAYLCCQSFDYKSGVEILILTHNLPHYKTRNVGPFTISQDHKMV